MDNQYFWREYKMEDRKIKKTRWLWLMFFISFSADKWHCNYLAQKYQCEVAELLFKTPFYWLSVLFGVVDLILGVFIWRRATVKYRLIPKKWKFFSFSSEIEKTNGAKHKTKIKGSIDLWELERCMAIVIIFISAHSLVVDAIKFIF